MRGTLIGVDEAGYGPNLGPLIVAATRWDVPDEIMSDGQALDELLTPFIQRTPVGDNVDAIAIADSKQLYSSGSGLGELERGVLSCLEVAQERPTSWQSLWNIAAPASASELFGERITINRFRSRWTVKRSTGSCQISEPISPRPMCS